MVSEDLRVLNRRNAESNYTKVSPQIHARSDMARAVISDRIGGDVWIGMRHFSLKGIAVRGGRTMIHLGRLETPIFSTNKNDIGISKRISECLPLRRVSRLATTSEPLRHRIAKLLSSFGEIQVHNSYLPYTFLSGRVH